MSTTLEGSGTGDAAVIAVRATVSLLDSGSTRAAATGSTAVMTVGCDEPVCRDDFPDFFTVTRLAALNGNASSIDVPRSRA